MRFQNHVPRAWLAVVSVAILGAIASCVLHQGKPYAGLPPEDAKERALKIAKDILAQRCPGGMRITEEEVYCEYTLCGNMLPGGTLVHDSPCVKSFVPVGAQLPNLASSCCQRAYQAKVNLRFADIVSARAFKDTSDDAPTMSYVEIATSPPFEAKCNETFSECKKNDIYVVQSFGGQDEAADLADAVATLAQYARQSQRQPEQKTVPVVSGATGMQSSPSALASTQAVPTPESLPTPSLTQGSVLASGQKTTVLGLGGGYLYWVNDNKSLRRIPVSGGTPSEVVSGELADALFVTDDEVVYGRSLNSMGYFDLLALRGKGKNPRKLLSSIRGGSWAVRDGFVYWAFVDSDEDLPRGYGFTVGRVAIKFGKPTILARTRESSDIAVTATHALWCSGGKELRMEIPSGRPAEVLPGCVSPVADDANFYWASESEEEPRKPRLMKLPAAATSAVVVGELPEGAKLLPARDGKVAWVARDKQASTVGTVAASSGSPKILTRLPAEVETIILDGNSVYWLQQDKIMKAPHAP